MISVVTWFWRAPNGPAFSVDYVNRLRNMLARNLHTPHELVLVTGEPTDGLDPRVRVVVPPLPLAGDMRCRRRMWQFAKERRHDLGERILAIDLDVVVVDDITELALRQEPVVCWKVGYAGAFSGSFVLFDAGALDGLWLAYAADPLGFPGKCGERNASDQAMLNAWLRGRVMPQWTERDGLRTWFGAGYEKFEFLGMGPTLNIPPQGTRVVVMGSADKAVLDEGRFAFVREHWR